jgi:hypothetical protein
MRNSGRSLDLIIVHAGWTIRVNRKVESFAECQESGVRQWIAHCARQLTK